MKEFMFVCLKLDMEVYSSSYSFFIINVVSLHALLFLGLLKTNDIFCLMVGSVGLVYFLRGYLFFKEFLFLIRYSEFLFMSVVFQDWLKCSLFYLLIHVCH